LIVLYARLLLLALSESFQAVNQATDANANRLIAADLSEDAAVFRRLFGERTEHLLESARLLSSDFAFKTAYSTADRETVLSAMDNHLGRIAGGDLMMLVSLDGEVGVATAAPDAPAGLANPRPELVAAAETDDYGVAAGLVGRAGRLFQMMVVPLLVPDLDAWILIGFEIDDDYARDLRQLILSEVAIVDTAAGAPRLIAGTLPDAQRPALPAAVAAGRLGAGATAAVELDGEPYLSSAIDPGRPSESRSEAGAEDEAEELSAAETAGAGRVLVVLQRPLAAELAPFERLRTTLLLLFAASLAVSIAAAVAIARSVTRPVLRLAEGARRIEAGDYSQRVELRRRDEIGELAGSFNHMARGLAEKERVRDLLGKVVSPAVAEELLSRELELGGEERVVSVLFSDVRNFTALCEGRSPAEILELLNRYLTEVSGVIEEQGGVVDKYIGDAVMALFGAPLVRPDHAARAVATGLGMQGCLERINRQLESEGLPRLGIGVGVNTDLVVAGNMGSRTRLNYTVIGDGVNLASRLEGLTKRYGVPLIVSDSTRSGAPGFVYRELDRVRVKGKRRAVAIFQPLGAEGEVAPAALDELGRFHRALELLRAGDHRGAGEAFGGLAGAAGADAALYRLYLERAERFVARPPEPPWDGTVEFEEK
jgi:adenylate cyclase